MNGMAKLLQGLFYISSLYQGYIAEHHLNIYSSTQLKLPKPKYIVFYNGTRDEPDRQELRLSASFAEEGGAPCIECVALVLNINYGRNRKLMEAVRGLAQQNPGPGQLRNLAALVKSGLGVCVDTGAGGKDRAALSPGRLT